MLRESQAFNQEVQEMLAKFNVIDTSKPVGGLPETAKDQQDRFMEVYHDLEVTGPKIGHKYLKKYKEGQAANLSNNLNSEQRGSFALLKHLSFLHQIWSLPLLVE